MSSDFWFPPNPKFDTTYFNEHRANENMYCFLQKKYYALTWNVPPWLTHLINNFWNQPLFTSFFLFIEIWEYFSQNITRLLSFADDSPQFSFKQLSFTSALLVRYVYHFFMQIRAYDILFSHLIYLVWYLIFLVLHVLVVDKICLAFGRVCGTFAEIFATYTIRCLTFGEYSEFLIYLLRSERIIYLIVNSPKEQRK